MEKNKYEDEYENQLAELRIQFYKLVEHDIYSIKDKVGVLIGKLSQCAISDDELENSLVFTFNQLRHIYKVSILDNLTK